MTHLIGGQVVGGFSPNYQWNFRRRFRKVTPTPGPEPGPIVIPPEDPVPVDLEPNGFSFAAKNNASPAATFISDPVTISGINGPAPISIEGGRYSIDGGPFTSTAGTVLTQQQVRVEVNTSGEYSTAHSATLTVGGVSAPFTVTTQGPPVTPDQSPDPFTFVNQTGVQRGVQVYSAPITITGITAPTAVSLSGYPALWIKNSGGGTNVPGTVVAGDTIALTLYASSQYSETRNVTLTVGDKSATFSVTTEAAPPADTTPDPIVFQPVINAELSTPYGSNPVQLTGIDTTVGVGVTGGTWSKNGGAGSTANGSAVNGDVLAVGGVSAATYSTTSTVTLSVGTITASFQITTKADPGSQPPDPDPGDFPPPLATQYAYIMDTDQAFLVDGTDVYLYDGAA